MGTVSARSSLIEIESGLYHHHTTRPQHIDIDTELPQLPTRAKSRTYPAVPQHDDELPLPLPLTPSTEDFPWGPASPTSTAEPFTPTRTRPSSPRATPPLFTAGRGGGGGGGLLTPPNEQEGDDAVVTALPSVWEPHRNRFRFIAVCLLNFGNGLGDSAPGALIPYMEAYYHVSYGIVSLIFVGNAIGFITGALLLDYLRHHHGRSRSLIFSQLLIATGGYIPLICSAPFPAIVAAFFCIGLGQSINLAIANTFAGGLQNSTTYLGLVHGAYGIGGTVGPLIATSIVAVAGAVWSRYYFITLGLVLFTAAFSSWAFRGFEDEQQQQQQQQQGDSLPLARTGSLLPASASLPSLPRSRGGGALTALSSRIVLLGALFIFAYQGAEVSISGWVTSFLITARHGDPRSVGYVTSGFWAGITLGRFVLSPLAQHRRLGERRFVYILTLGAAIFELLVWLVPNIVGDAISVAVVGLLLGPVYPCAAAVFMRSLTKREQMSGLGVISAFGSSGGAVAPFTTGMLAQAAGTFVLHPIAIALFGVMGACWWGLPDVRKRKD